MEIDIFNINIIRKQMINRKIYWTKHCLNRIHQRNILISNIKLAIKNGEIIETYYNDYPYPSCLILGKDESNKNLHVVCGINNDIIHIITAYYPGGKEWKEDMKTRRKK